MFRKIACKAPLNLTTILAVILTGFVFIGCNQSKTGSIAPNKNSIVLRTTTTTLELDEGGVAPLKVDLLAPVDQEIVLRWLLINSQQGIYQKIKSNLSKLFFQSVSQSVHSNFSDTSGALTVPAGETSATLQIQSTSDGAFSPKMHFELAIVSDLIESSLIVPVVINDTDGLPDLGVYDTYAVKGQKARVTMSLDHRSKIALPVEITTQNQTALYGVDYEVSTQSITIPPEG